MRLRKTVWEKAKDIIEKEKIEYVGRGNKREWYDVADIRIEIRESISGKVLSCTCKHHSVYGSLYDGLCCYKAALISYLVNK